MTRQMRDPTNRKFPGNFRADERISDLLQKLEDLYSLTDPSLGTESEKDKELRSIFAIGIGGRLFEMVAGWAIDHQVGLAISGRGMSSNGSPLLRKRQNASPGISENNFHEHEIKGRNATKISPLQQRRALINIMFPAHGFIPDHMHSDLIEALESLDHGYPSEIFQYRNSSNKLNLRQRQLILKGILFASYAAARDGNQALRGMQIVEAFGLTGEKTFASWLNSSKNFFGETRVGTEMLWARACGDESQEHKRLLREGRTDLAQQFARNEARYGDVAIGEAAKEFRSLLKSRKRKNGQPK